MKIMGWFWFSRSNQSHGMKMMECNEINAMISIIQNNQSHGIKMMPK
jgi:hypothetical protein